VFLASLLRDAAARLRIWYSRSRTEATAAATSDAASEPIPHSTQQREAAGYIQVVSPPRRRRPIQPRPTLWTVRTGGGQWRLYCGPLAVAALIGADVDEVIRVIQLYRGHRRQVRGTRPEELQYVFRHLGHDMQLVADLSRNSPTLATWERERADWEFEQAWLLIVTGHWVAVCGRWFVDTWTAGKPVRIADAPRRRKRVRFVYRITAAVN
jgi:hypothetical protein